MSEDSLVRRLRQFQADEPGFPPLFSRAAAEIESLRAQIANARKALEAMRAHVDQRQNGFVSRASSIYQGIHIAEELADVGLRIDAALKELS